MITIIANRPWNTVGRFCNKLYKFTHIITTCQERTIGNHLAFITKWLLMFIRQDHNLN